jgi:hypothetical protein
VSGTTISKPQTTTVNITQASQNPVTVTAAGSVIVPNGTAIQDFLSNGTITNLGKLSGFNDGVYGGAVLVNGSNNDTTASITGGNMSVATGNGSLTNFGTINGNIQMSGTIVNGSATDKVASITAYIAATGMMSLTNFGTMTSAIAMTGGGGNTLTNGSDADTTATITGDVVTAGSPASTIHNFGTIIGTGNGPLDVLQTATIVNGSTADSKALLEGGYWGAIVNAGTLTNYGTIEGTNGVSFGSGTLVNEGTISSNAGFPAVQFDGTLKLIEKPGAFINGTIHGVGTLEIASTGGSLNIGSGISDSGSLMLDPNVDWSVNGSVNLSTLINNGTVSIGASGSLDIAVVDPSSTGTFDLSGKLQVTDVLGSKPKIQFSANASAELTISNASKFGLNVGLSSYSGPLLESFKVSDTIDVMGLGTGTLAATYTPSSGDLQITANGKAAATLAFQDSTLGSGSFHVAADGYGGALITHS